LQRSRHSQSLILKGLPELDETRRFRQESSLFTEPDAE